MKPPLFLAACLLGCALPGVSLAKDPRLAERLYSPNEVVRIDGQLGVQASIAFAEDERIENVAVGDSASWQITPNKRANMLFIKPLAAKARTNMTVITDQRTYYFDLVGGAARPLYVLRFSYPEEPKPIPHATPAPSLSEEEARLAQGERPADPALLNFQWTKRGDPRIQPLQLYDDGVSTYLTWARDVPLPAILIRDEKGAEGPVNYAVRGDTIVIEGVHSPILLRAGRNFAQLEYSGPPRPSPSAPAPAAVATVSRDQ